MYGGGDPSFPGWTACILYFVAAGCVFRRMKLEKADHEGRWLEIWKIIAFLLILMGFNKQLDLQTWLMSLGRQVAKEVHVYEHRLLFHVSLFLSLMFMSGFL